MTTTNTNAARQLGFIRAGMQKISDAARTMFSAVVGPELYVLLGILALVVAWGLAIATWGYPALIIVALFLVFVIFAGLMLITVGK
ncbi:hypothetical protein [uncultured Tateyamaria sp.]|uniref:hypothetical protein n=1 Tax=uncultured Tateyamaria sp. TaxID=455651 RepID=UPI00262C8122|nr:hypothetical protein [uncultured Tateyamaria sp.]